MSTLPALHLARQRAARVERAVVLAPPPPTGFGAGELQLAASRAVALADEATQLAYFTRRADSRLSAAWTAFKVGRWRATADPRAAAAYVVMCARDGLPARTTRISIPVLGIPVEQDAPPMRREAVSKTFGAICDALVDTSLADSGHYPMQEVPPLTVALAERFLGG